MTARPIEFLDLGKKIQRSKITYKKDMFFTEHIQDQSIHTRVCRTHTTPITSEQQTYQEGVEPTHTLNVFSEGTYREHVELYMTCLMSLVQTY